MIERIGRYEILQELGRGAMGAVYKARDPQIGRTVAIKQILTANFAPEELNEYRQRFRREAQTAGQMSHPGIVTIFDIAEDEQGHPFLVMEFVEGVTLHRRLAPTPDGRIPERQPLADALDICIQVADALDYAHRRNVVHRDIKPANVLLTPEGRIKIADFGIAKFTDTEATSTGHVMGTPSYMSPEQIRGGATDARSDIFSLGAMLYWMTTGSKPFPGDTLTTVSFQVVFAEPAPPRTHDPALPEELEIILSRCLAKKAEDRYAAARELMRDLQALRDGKPITATRAPVEPTMEETLTITRPEAAEAEGVTLDELRAAAAKRAAEAKAAPAARSWSTLVLTVILLLLAAAMVVVLWPGTWVEAPPSLPAPQSSAARVASPPAPAAAPGAATPATPESLAGVTTGSATLAVECNHNFRDGKLEILSDGQPLLSEELEGKGGFLRSTRGALNASVALPAGERTLKVRVSSERDKYEEEKEITGKFDGGATKTLLIEFGKGSGIGIGTRKLTLKFREEPKSK